jgi:hypothetical protein
MSALNKNVTRTILGSSEKTFETMSRSADTISFALTTTDKFYVGYKEKFQSRYFLLSTVNSVSTSVVTVKYWNGTEYATVEDLVDQTRGFTRNGFISWNNLSDWQKKAQTGVADVELYWVEITVSVNMAAAVLQCVENIFCSEDDLRSYYPELVYDARYLPPGRTTFIDQFVAARDLIVTRLKQDGIIKDESQILDINQVTVPAVHATAWIIMDAIAKDDGDKETAKAMYGKFNMELNQSHKSFDLDNSGTIDSVEENIGTVFIARR